MEGVSEDAGPASGAVAAGNSRASAKPPTPVGFYGSGRAAQTCSFYSAFSFPSLYWFPRAAIRESTIWVASGQTFILQGS